MEKKKEKEKQQTKHQEPKKKKLEFNNKYRLEQVSLTPGTTDRCWSLAY